MKGFWKLAVLSATFVAGCTKSGTTRIGDLVMQEATIDTVVALTDEVHSPTCELSVHFLYATGKDSVRLNTALRHSNLLPADFVPDSADKDDIHTFLNHFSKAYLAAYRRENKGLYLIDRQHADTYTQALLISTAAKSLRNGVLTYETTTITKVAGNETYRESRVVNIDMRTGQTLTPDSLLLHGYETRLKAVLTRKLMDRFHCSDLSELATRHGVLVNQEMYIPANFIAGQDRLTFIFNPDEIAPHLVGEIRLVADRKDLGKILK